MIFFEHTTFEKKTIDIFYFLELFTARESPFYIPHPNCAVCKQAAAMVEGMVKDKENMDKIKEALTTFCPQIRVVDPKKCKAKADKWAPMMIKLISDNASPEMVCQALMICKVKG